MKSIYFLDIECLTKTHIDLLRNKFNIKTHQVKRVASSYFLKSKGAGRPERFIRTNNIMKQWMYQFLSTYDKAPSVEETLNHGQYIKSLNMAELVNESHWKCSKGWAKRFLVKNGFYIQS